MEMHINQMEDYKTWSENLMEEIGEITPEELETISKQFQPTPENIKALGAIDEETARCHFYIMNKINDKPFMDYCFSDGLSNPGWTDEELQLRAMSMPDFFQAITEVVFAMSSGKIKASFNRVVKKLPYFFKQTYNHNGFKFQCVINELNNIARGKLTF